ncbi:MAG: UDP-N-acetylglucosamine 2-epimerase [Candidatus Peregrinibacteria bacterium Greene0416_19]|nr:MAG: UDP-N-acetylglucosamine 2-epimerase [Candidatus Peregrinibacteria bacterium Greene0416_19]
MRTICVVVGSRANYSSIKSVMRAVQAHPDLALQVVVGASALLDRYGSVVKFMEKDGFAPDERVHMLIEGETPLTMAQSTGLGLIELARVFDRLRPDAVVTVGDRFETMATAVAAAYMNIPLAHTMGGEVSGTIDESIRHAVTKLAQLHFPSNDRAADRIIRMGEDPKRVHVVGCPRMDLVAEVARLHSDPASLPLLLQEGVGGGIDFRKPYLLVMQHPVTTEYGQGRDQIEETLKAIEELHIPTIFFWPNADAGSEDIAQGIRIFREHKDDSYIRFYKNLPVETFIPIMRHCACMVGNSSAAIREGSFLGVPVVNVGTRQTGRDRGANILDAGHDHAAIVSAVKKQLAHGPYEPDTLYGDGTAGEKIADILSTATLSVQKQLTY